MAWRIRFDGQAYREADLTIEQAERIEALTDLSWVAINPFRSAKCAKALLSVMVADRTNAPLDEVMAKVGAIRTDEFTDMVEVDEDDLPSEYTDGFPPQAAGTSTDT